MRKRVTKAGWWILSLAIALALFSLPLILPNFFWDPADDPPAWHSVGDANPYEKTPAEIYALITLEDSQGWDRAKVEEIFERGHLEALRAENLFTEEVMKRIAKELTGKDMELLFSQ